MDPRRWGEAYAGPYLGRTWGPRGSGGSRGAVTYRKLAVASGVPGRIQKKSDERT